MNYRVPTKREMLIMEQNGLDPDKYAVCSAADDYLHLLHYRTRDTLWIYRGDKKWPEETKEGERCNGL